MREARNVSTDIRVNIHGGDWQAFIKQLGFDPLGEIGAKHGSFTPSDYHSFPNIRAEYVVKWDSQYVDDYMVNYIRYRSRTTYIWWL